MDKAKLLITVRTYPQPATSHGEVVCTAGVMEDGRWIRIHPVPFRLEEYQRFTKYQWIELDLKKHRTDKRPESYHPVGDHRVLGYVDTSRGWMQRRELVLKKVYYSYPVLLDDVMSEDRISLAVLKPSEIVDFVFEETAREWPEKWKQKWLQGDFFHEINTTEVIRKVPYRFYYVFKTENDQTTHRISLTDWEVGALYWKCLHSCDGDERIALEKVRMKYLDEFKRDNDIYFFMGSHYEHHIKGYKNPLMIVGVFYPPKETQLKLDLFSGT